jgi:hypothetical protein
LTNSYSDLCTSASFSSQKSSESFYSNNNNNISQFVQNKVFLVPTNLSIYQSPRKLASSMNYRIDLNNNNLFFNRNLSSKAISNIKNNNNLINQKINQNYASFNYNNNNSLIKDNKISNFIINNNYNISNNINEASYFNNQKSIDFTDKKIIINDEKVEIESLNGNNSNNTNGLQKTNSCDNNINVENRSGKKSKSHYNKFNTTKENNMNENTVILTLKIKVAKNDYRIFNLKKYDDLFVSLEKFVDINKIKQELVKPLVTKIFHTLNKIFWLFNNKIGIYDQEYLGSLYRLWVKNNKQIPKSNKNQSDKSTNDSSNESNDNSPEKIKSNSFQNTDENNDEKDSKHKTKTI